ncbi:Hypothetical predicted protein [Mytilus galloprovincialis]|uniref:WSC domain-containing protein n=1 Tax=Mytilus galloprovincialis TaxID=29158 RepID=A0A8B6ETE3_MYTGA|nr:Hypothetical predicted protein [Mytilus galloprovincialis]
MHMRGSIFARYYRKTDITSAVFDGYRCSRKRENTQKQFFTFCERQIYMKMVKSSGERRKHYIGCYVDQQTRTLPYGQLNDNTMTNDKCVSHCCSFLDDATYMGTQAGYQCFCTNVTNTNNFVQINNPADCHVDCGGHPGETCGGFWTLSVYKIECLTDTTSATYSPTTSYIPSVTTDITTESTTGVVKSTRTPTVTVTDRCSECPRASCLQINSTIWTTVELSEKLELLKNAISINKKETNSYKATKTSANDPRKSSRNIGIVGVIVLVVPVIFVIVMDIQSIFK